MNATPSKIDSTKAHEPERGGARRGERDQRRHAVVVAVMIPMRVRHEARDCIASDDEIGRNDKTPHQSLYPSDTEATRAPRRSAHSMPTDDGATQILSSRRGCKRTFGGGGDGLTGNKVVLFDALFDKDILPNDDIKSTHDPLPESRLPRFEPRDISHRTQRQLLHLRRLPLKSKATPFRDDLLSNLCVDILEQTKPFFNRYLVRFLC